MKRVLLSVVTVFFSLCLLAQEGYTKKTAEKMLAEMTTGGEKVVINREITVGSEYTDFTFAATSSAKGYNVVLVFPYSIGYTNFEGYFTYGNEAKRLPFKFTKGERVGYLLLKVPSKPEHTAHLRFKDISEMPGTLCRLMVVEYY